MMPKNSLKLLLGAALITATAVHAEPAVIEHSTQAAPLYPTVVAQLEDIPDDIWSTISSPFDPITTPSGFAPQRRVEQMQPRQPIRQQATPQAATPRPAVTIMAPPPPQLQTEPQPQNRYSRPEAPLTATITVPHQLPPQEKVVVAGYPEEYWDCLLNNLQGIGSDVAAKLITRARQKKHPKR